MDKKIYQYCIASLILLVVVYMMYEYKTKQMIETEFKKLMKPKEIKINYEKPNEDENENVLRMEDIDSYIDPVENGKNDSEE